MSQEWYYSVEGDRQGPVSAQELKKLVEAGTLKATDLVWKDGMADWVPAKTIKGLFAAGASSAGTPAPASAPTKTAEKPAPVDEDEEEERPKKRREVAKRDEDEEEDEPRPKKRRRDEDEDEEDEPRPKKRRRSGNVPDDVGSKKMTAGILAILIGWLGIHKFYLGMTTPGVIMMLVSVLSCTAAAPIMSIIAIVEGIMYLTKSDEEFYQMYVLDKKGWF
ncbi:GYF domain-containing protein [Zavarzinella formosa]|uniref:GYF domain-containing protein n=1 Tax=Zavarzinella formosa TaxID=360055 RepID=UPI0002F2D545|nr:GYF domain-containing protein [Zavarzinella formosa]